MNFEEAKILIKQYWKIVKATEGQIARDQSILPWPKAMIKEAYFIYAKEMVKSGNLSVDKIDNVNNFIDTYNRLAQFVEKEDASEYIQTHKKQKTEAGRKELSKDQIKRFNRYLTTDYLGGNETEEIMMFLDMLYHKNNQVLNSSSIAYKHESCNSPRVSSHQV